MAVSAPEKKRISRSQRLREEREADEHARWPMSRSVVASLARGIVLTAMAVVVLVPFFYMLLISLKAPSEVGNRRLLPAGLESLLQPGSGRLAWVRSELTDEQAAVLAGAETLYVGPASASNFVARALPAPPRGTVAARVLALDKPRTGEGIVSAILEAPDPEGLLAHASDVSLFIPAPVAGTWMAVSATATERRVRDVVGRLFVNYRELLRWKEAFGPDGGLMAFLRWTSHGYPRWFLNSLLVALTTVLLGVFFDSLAAFAFAKFNFPGRDILFAVLLLTVMIPYPVTLVPTFFIFAKLGLYNTYAALIIPGLVSAFGIFLVRQYLQSVPDDMIDAAHVDGAGDFNVYWHVILPTARPVLAALAVFRFIFQWNTYLYPLVLTNRDSMKTLQLGLATLEDAHGSIDYGLQMAGAAIAVVPVLVIYMFMQKHFISGITMGAVKD